MNKISPDGLTMARAYRPPGGVLPEEVDEFSNQPSLHLQYVYCIHYDHGSAH